MNGCIFVFVTIGIPASGKSTFADHFSLKHNLCVISTDDIRIRKYGNLFNNKIRQGTLEEMIRQAKIAAESGVGFILDTTFLNKRCDRIDIIKRIRDFDIPMRIVAVIFDVPIEECMRRNANRIEMKKVPDEVIKYHFEALEIPSSLEPGIDEIINGVSYE